MRLRFRTRRQRLFSLALILVILAVSAYQSGWLNSIGKKAELSQPGLYSVHQFIDGDTISVDMNGSVETVRFIGVDTPETHKPNTPVQCYGPEAAAHTQALIGTSRVRLQADPLDTNRDRYGRLLRYIYLPDGTLIDQKIIQDGYGFAYTQFPFDKTEQFKADEQAAKAARLGLWAACSVTIEKSGVEQTQ